MRLMDELAAVAGAGKRTARNVAASGLPRPTGFRAPVPFGRLQSIASRSEVAARAGGALRTRHTGRWIAGAAIGAAVVSGMGRRTGRAADRISGRPTGIYGF